MRGVKHTRTDGPRFPGGADMVIVALGPMQEYSKRFMKKRTITRVVVSETLKTVTVVFVVIS